MVTRIHDMQPYSTHTEKMDAALYNLWRRVRLHITLPTRLKLSALKSMRLVLENDCWVVVDSSHNDLPMIAWLKFQDAGRDSLHTPVACTVNYYHFMAHQYHERVLQNITQTFEDCL